MIKSIISLVLLIVSVLLNFKHGWDTFRNRSNPDSIKMMNDLGISATAMPIFVFVAFAVGVLLLIPKTFFTGNVLNAVSIVLIMALALRSGKIQIALMEIPFLAMPLIMIWLKYPFKN